MRALECDTESLTDAVVARLDECKDPRFKQSMTSLARHLHDFVRDVAGPACRSRMLECADGKWIALHMSWPEKFWQEALITLLGAAFRTRSREQWCNRLLALDVPHAPMYDASEALVDPQAKHLQLLVSAQHSAMGEFRTVRSPVSFDGERSLNVRPPPTLGEHNGELDAMLVTGKPANVRTASDPARGDHS